MAPVHEFGMQDESGDAIVMKFWLNKGCYATSLLQEYFKRWT